MTALDGVSFRVEPGEIVGLVGRNGAGKTTAMRAIMGIIATDEGAVSWNQGPIGDAQRLRFGYAWQRR